MAWCCAFLFIAVDILHQLLNFLHSSQAFFHSWYLRWQSAFITSFHSRLLDHHKFIHSENVFLNSSVWCQFLAFQKLLLPNVIFIHCSVNFLAKNRSLLILWLKSSAPNLPDLELFSSSCLRKVDKSLTGLGIFDSICLFFLVLLWNPTACKTLTHLIRLDTLLM